MKIKIKNKILKFIYFVCENSKLVYPRYLGYFYYHGTMILPCIRQPETFRNWVNFCGQGISILLQNWFQLIVRTCIVHSYGLPEQGMPGWNLNWKNYLCYIVNLNSFLVFFPSHIFPVKPKKEVEVHSSPVHLVQD